MYVLRRTVLQWATAKPLLRSTTSGAAFCTQTGSLTVTIEEEPMFIGAYTPVTKKLWEQRLMWAQQNKQEQGNQQQQQQEQVPRGPIRSKPPEVSTVTYPFSKDKGLVEMYRNPWGFVRIGRILEDLDSLAGTIAFSHCQPVSPGSPAPLLVTAAVDAIEAQHPLAMSADMIMRGQVVWTGRTALDIRMELIQEKYAPEPSLVALFSFVHLDPETKRPAPIPQLEVGGPGEEAWAAERQLVATQRKALRERGREGGDVLPPLKQQQLEALKASARLQVDMPALAPGNTILMGQTSLSNSFICQPQQRNLHGRIFGGFLMRRAFELAFTTTYMFAGTRPTCVRVDDISFRRPVDVGDLLRFHSYVIDVHSEALDKEDPEAVTRPHLVTVDVEAVVSQPEHRTSVPTNNFRFIFRVHVPVDQPLRTVLPGTAADEMRLRSYWGEMNE